MINVRSSIRLLVLTLGLLATSAGAQEAVSPECRGVAAGVVAAMRAAGELSGEAANEAAIVAARRACTAAREELGAAPVGTPETTVEKATAADKVSVWDLLTSDQDEKPGNKRLKRLRQQ